MYNTCGASLLTTLSQWKGETVHQLQIHVTLYSLVGEAHDRISYHDE